MTTQADLELRARILRLRDQVAAREAQVFAGGPERVAARRDERLADLLRLARERSPWHGERLADVEPEGFTAADLTSLPVMTKADVMAHWDSVVARPGLTLATTSAHLERVAADGPSFLAGHLVWVTGGSTGTRGVVPWHWSDLAELRGTSAALGAALGRPPVPARTAFVWAASAVHLSRCWAWLDAADPRAEFGYRSAGDRPGELVDWLNSFLPQVLGAYPSVLEDLARAQERGALRIGPAAVVGVGEPFTDATRAACRRAWDVEPTDVYSATECPGLALSVPGTPGLVQNEAIAILEVVDRDHRPVPTGTMGDHVLLTSLCNRTLPLIRYELSDQLSALPRRPGDLLPCITPPVGRSDDWFTYPGGARLHPHVVRSALAAEPHVVHYRVLQRPAGLHLVVEADGAVAFDRLCRQLAQELGSAGVSRPEVTVEQVERIDRHPDTGKVRRFVAGADAHP